MKLRLNILFFLALFTTLAYSQIEEYNYQKELSGIKEQWHGIEIPTSIYGKVSKQLRDVRIFGITAANDTIEAPYLRQVLSGKKIHDLASFKTINTSKNEKGFYFTFAIDSKQSINQLFLDFKQQNFDWKVTIEGSSDLKEWFTIAEDQRILSIKNELTSYAFTTVKFPNSQYVYYRLLIKSKEKPVLSKVNILRKERLEASFDTYEVQSLKVSQDKRAKQTIINLTLPNPAAISHLKLVVDSNVDYYRSTTIKYLVDSVHTEKGWKYNYRTLAAGKISSLETNEFVFPSETAQKLKLIIDNGDNQPLKITAVNVKGYKQRLVARFNVPATYYLVYGNKSVRFPKYDIAAFKDQIPENNSLLSLGKEVSIAKKTVPKETPLFENSLWLWITMLIIILLLGWFSVKMISKK